MSLLCLPLDNQSSSQVCKRLSSWSFRFSVAISIIICITVLPNCIWGFSILEAVHVINKKNVKKGSWAVGGMNWGEVPRSLPVCIWIKWCLLLSIFANGSLSQFSFTSLGYLHMLDIAHSAWNILDSAYIACLDFGWDCPILRIPTLFTHFTSNGFTSQKAKI